MVTTNAHRNISTTSENPDYLGNSIFSRGAFVLVRFDALSDDRWVGCCHEDLSIKHSNNDACAATICFGMSNLLHTFIL